MVDGYLSVDPEGFHRVDSAHSPSGNVSSEQRRHAEHSGHGDKGYRIPHVDGEEQTGQQSAGHHCQRQPDHAPDPNEPKPATGQEPDDRMWAGP